MANIVIFGPPGSGKGTQSQRIKEKYNLAHISTGEMLRDRIERGTELGKLADSYISKGNLVPDEVIVSMLEKEMEKAEAAGGIILDGFPRTVRQAEALDKMLKRRGSEISHVIGLEVPDEMVTERLLKRGEESGRSDDNAEAIKQRLEVYHNTTVPVKEYYSRQGLYRPVDGSKEIEEIFRQINDLMS